MRIGVRVTRFAVRTGVHVTGRAVAIAADVVQSVAGAPAQQRTHDRPAPPSPPPPAPAPAVVARTQDTTPQPSHVSEEPVLVEEVAEPGAEDGAGAEVAVAEPWEGYRQMNAADVIDRLRVATPAELAVVQLYEHANRERETVLSAVRHELRAADNTRKEQPDGQ